MSLESRRRITNEPQKKIIGNEITIKKYLRGHLIHIPNTIISPETGIAIVNEKKTDLKKIENIHEDFEKCLKIMSKTIRTVNEIQLLANFLGTLDEFTKLIKASNENQQELLFSTSCTLRHELAFKNRIVFKYGNILLIKVIRVRNTI